MEPDPQITDFLLVLIEMLEVFFTILPKQLMIALYVARPSMILDAVFAFPREWFGYLALIVEHHFFALTTLIPVVWRRYKKWDFHRTNPELGQQIKKAKNGSKK